MSSTLVPISFWSPDIKVKEVISASYVSDFNLAGKTLNGLGERLNYSSLSRVMGTNEMVLKMRNNEFIEFVEG